MFELTIGNEDSSALKPSGICLTGFDFDLRNGNELDSTPNTRKAAVVQLKSGLAIEFNVEARLRAMDPRSSVGSARSPGHLGSQERGSERLSVCGAACRWWRFLTAAASWMP